MFVILVAATVAALMILSRYYQLCPHCRRIVRRAARGWKRCPGCRRQYHRSVRPLRH